MAVMTIRNIDDAIMARLRLRAVRNGRSMEEEAQEILRAALSREVPPRRNLADAVRERFGALSGVDLPDVPRESIRPSVDFGQ